MLVASHRVRYLVLALVLTWMALMIFTRPAHGAWSADPVRVYSTSALCPAVSAVDDAHFGAIIVWQENTANGGLLKAQHVLANGDLDPSWGASMLVSTKDVVRVDIGAVSDGAGGAYVWWMDGVNLLLNHVTASGTIASGWPAAGRAAGILPTDRHRPAALADGQGGIYLGWLTRSISFDPTVSIRVVRLGPTGAGVGGWPAGGRSFGLVGDAGVSVAAFGMDTAPGGELWLGWQTIVSGPQQVQLPGELRILRVSPAGLPASGWTTDGVVLAPYDPSFTNAPGWSVGPLTASQVAVARDDGSGAFVLASQGATNGEALVFHNTLRHVDAVGQPAIGWGAEGVSLGDVYASGVADPGEDGSLRALADHQGGVFTGLPFFASEATAAMNFSRRSPAGEPLPGGVGAGQRGIEFAPRGDGGMFVASFKPSGATGPFEGDAYIAVSQSDPGAGFSESKTSYAETRYGDVGLTATGDGGAIFAWSQLIDRQGIFAIRLGPAGAVTAAPPAPVIGAPSLHVRFVRGEGVHAVTSFAGRVTFSLHDVAGRRVASFGSEGTLGADVVIPGTRDLPGGVYFVRAGDGTHGLDARVLVLR